MPTFRTTVLFLFKATALIICTILCVFVIGWIALFVLPQQLKEDMISSLGFTHYGEKIDESEDLSYANTPANDHVYVGQWIMNCLKIHSVRDIPANIYSDFAPPGNLGEGNRGAEPITLLVSYKNLIRLSKYVSSARLSLNNNVKKLYSFYQISTIITIALGFITTVLVSLRSTEFGQGDTRIAKSIRVLAIVFPALGTASAAIIAFYSPQAKMNSASHTSANLAQLDSQITLGIAELGCASGQDDDNDKALGEKVLQWTKRYQDIQTVAETTPSGGTKTDETGAPDSNNTPPGTVH
jgi:hypothetical protein